MVVSLWSQSQFMVSICAATQFVSSTSIRGVSHFVVALVGSAFESTVHMLSLCSDLLHTNFS